MQDFGKEKCNIYVDFNTCLHIAPTFVGAHIVCITRESEGVKEQTQIADRTQMHS